MPKWIAFLEDGIFEGLKNGEAKAFPLKFLQAIPVGARITEAHKHEFLHWLLKNNLSFDKKKFPQVKKVVDEVAEMHYRAMLGQVFTEKEWKSAESAAELAAESGWAATRSARSAQAKKLLEILENVKVA